MGTNYVLDGTLSPGKRRVILAGVSAYESSTISRRQASSLADGDLLVDRWLSHAQWMPHSASNDASMSKVLGLGPSKCTRKPSFPGWPVTRGMRKEKQYLSSATGLPRLTRSPPDGCQGVPDANDGLGFII